MSNQQSFSYVGTGLPVLNQYEARINAAMIGEMCLQGSNRLEKNLN